MAKKKNSGSVGLVGALVIGVIAVLASVPKDVWIGIGVVAAVGIAIYLYRRPKGARPMRTLRAVVKVESLL